MQAKLLRALETREVTPIGALRPEAVDFRLCAATHKDLSVLVESGLFRQDLFFRLDVLRVPVPALRERTDDIPVLVEAFLGRSLEGVPARCWRGSARALDYLCTCDWPGNVRQLQAWSDVSW